MADTEQTRESNRKARKRYYYRNLEACRKRARERYARNKEEWKKRVAKWKEERDYDKKYYEANKGYQISRERLRARCRPDLLRKAMFATRFPGVDASNIEFEEELAEFCEEIYQKKLRKLRELFGRDPETGRKLSRNPETVRMIEEA